MVDFSNYQEVNDWLELIEPPERRREAAVTLAARVALRIAPLVGAELGRKESRDAQTAALSELVLPCLRATALPWVAARYPAHANDLRAVAEAASTNSAAVDAAAAAATRRAIDAAAAATARAAAEAAFSTAAITAAPGDIDDPGTARVAAIAALQAAATAAVFATADAAVLATRVDAVGVATIATTVVRGAAVVVKAAALSGAIGRAASDDSVAAVADDAALIISGRSGTELAGLPLWQKGQPVWAREVWQSLKPALLAAAEGWDVWIEWYEARLAGVDRDPPNEALEVARAMISN